jgi:hypothetical protein
MKIIPFQISNYRINPSGFQYKTKYNFSFDRAKSKLVDGEIKINKGQRNKLADCEIEMLFFYGGNRSMLRTETISFLELQRILANDEFITYAYSVNEKNEFTFYKQKCEVTETLSRDYNTDKDETGFQEAVNFKMRLLQPFWVKTDIFVYDEGHITEVVSPDPDVIEWLLPNTYEYTKIQDINIDEVTQIVTSFDEEAEFGTTIEIGVYPSTSYELRFDIPANSSITFASNDSEIIITNDSSVSYTDILFDSETYETIRFDTKQLIPAITAKGFLLLETETLLTTPLAGYTIRNKALYI